MPTGTPRLRFQRRCYLSSEEKNLSKYLEDIDSVVLALEVKLLRERRNLKGAGNTLSAVPILRRIDELLVLISAELGMARDVLAGVLTAEGPHKHFRFVDWLANHERVKWVRWHGDDAERALRFKGTFPPYWLYQQEARARKRDEIREAQAEKKKKRLAVMFDNRYYRQPVRDLERKQK